MALSNADHQRAYRKKKAAKALIMQQDLEILRKEIGFLRKEMAKLLQNQELKEIGLLRKEMAKLLQNQELILQKSNAEAAKPQPAQTPKKRLDLPTPPWQPNPRHYEIASKLGHSRSWVDDQAEQYLDWQENAARRCASSNRRHIDYNAGFRNWIKTQPLTNGHHHDLFAVPEYRGPRTPAPKVQRSQIQ